MCVIYMYKCYIQSFVETREGGHTSDWLRPLVDIRCYHGAADAEIDLTFIHNYLFLKVSKDFSTSNM